MTRRRVCSGCGVLEGMFHQLDCPTSSLPIYKEEPIPVPSGDITIALPPEVMQYQHDIRRFVEAMVYKLALHASKGRWENKTIVERLDRLDGEVFELKEAAQRGNMVEILLEAADVANYGLIISAIAMERGK